MKILITNIWMHHYGGTEVYVRDLAYAMIRQKIHVEVYTTFAGKIADDMRNAGILVTDNVNYLKETPDLIHAQHYVPTLEVISRFPGVPLVYSLHDKTHPLDFPPKYSRIIKYFAVDYNCLDRLIIENGIPESKTEVIYNWVDQKKFPLKEKINHRPVKALVFSNYANEDNYYKEIKRACNQLGIHLDGIGIGLNNPQKNPQNFLPEYDIVFAKAKAAMEAISTGAAVILCDFMGLGEIVTTGNFDHLRRYNFGMKTLTRKINSELIIEEIKKYDPVETMNVALKIRQESSYEKTTNHIIKTYKYLIESDNINKKEIDDLDAKLISDYNSLKLLFKEIHFKEVYAELNSAINLPEFQKPELRDTIIDLNRKLSETDQPNQAMIQIISNQNHIITEMRTQFSMVVNSFSFKIGRMITLIPRLIKRLIKKQQLS